MKTEIMNIAEKATELILCEIGMNAEVEDSPITPKDIIQLNIETILDKVIRAFEDKLKAGWETIT